MIVQTQITLKHLDFIDDANLREVLRERLEELDNVFPTNANYSTVFLSIGAIEGIFKHLAALYKPQILALNPPDYPTKRNGDRIAFDDLTIENLYKVLSKVGSFNLLAGIPNYEGFYQLFRLYRNFVHPQVQVDKNLNVGLGQAQMALGLLNATIQALDCNLIIGKQIFEKICGEPRYDSQGVLNLPRSHTRHHSFIVMREPVKNNFHLACDLDFSPSSLLNFVFNYVDPGNFRMLRLDRRPELDCANGILRSSQRYWWDFEFHATPQKLPIKELLHAEIDIDFASNRFACIVDGTTYTFEDPNDHTQRDIFILACRDRRIGFFNEVGTVKISNLTITVG
ncbi:MAG: hypothetical protein JXA73_05220 [Acidobacteria bacterium]|nr:hypothetical protein [Acidobacteriota bacterium]